MKTIFAEWKKIWSVRSSRIYLLFSAAASILTGLFLSLTTSVTQGRPLSELESMEILSVNLLGVDAAAIFLLVFAAVSVGREFQQRTLLSYLSAFPGRKRYLFSKAAVFFLLALTMGVLVALFALLNGQLLVSAVHKQMPASLAVRRLAAGCIFMPIFYTLLAVCAAFCTGSTAAGIAAPVLVLFLPMLAKLLPETLQSAVIPFLPSSAVHTLSGAAEKGVSEYTGILPAFLILGFWLLAAGSAAVRRFCRRDI